MGWESLCSTDHSRPLHGKKYRQCENWFRIGVEWIGEEDWISNLPRYPSVHLDSLPINTAGL
ncbi:hypothetical protein AVEN_22126-1, partial [Araneus ventricosus]